MLKASQYPRANTPFLFELRDHELKALSQTAHIHRYPKTTMIILAQEKGSKLFIIRKGRVKVSIYGEDGREIVLSILTSGDIFGETSLLDGTAGVATVMALEDTEALVVRRADLLRLIEEFPQIAIKFLSELINRLRKTEQKVESLALRDVTARIIFTLFQLAEDVGTPGSQGMLVRNRPSHRMLASMSATTRETVTRTLKRLENEGYIACTSRDLRILRQEDLRSRFLV